MKLHECKARRVLDHRESRTEPVPGVAANAKPRTAMRISNQAGRWFTTGGISQFQGYVAP